MSNNSKVHAQLRTSPHVRETDPVHVIMRNVVYALVPVCLFSIYQFGISALALIMTCVLACVGTEHGFAKWSGRKTPVGDWSVVITGLLLALSLPPGFPLWMAVVASIFGVGVGKVFFGGLGYNVMNPALVGRAFAQAAFTVPITTWTPAMVSVRFSEFIPSTLTPPFLKPIPVDDWITRVADGFTGATPLALMKFEGLPTEEIKLLLGTTAGSAGEASALLILLCGVYLVIRKMMDWRLAFSTLFFAGLTSGVFFFIDPGTYPHPIQTICSGGLMLGAVFMVTDMVASPVTPLGVWIYGGLIGFIAVIIRLFGGLPEGVMYAILLGNALSPLISAATQPRIYGAVKRKKA